MPNIWHLDTYLVKTLGIKKCAKIRDCHISNFVHLISEEKFSANALIYRDSRILEGNGNLSKNRSTLTSMPSESANDNLLSKNFLNSSS